MAIRLSGPQTLSPIGRTLRGRWHDSYRMQRHWHMGAAHETLASRRDPPCDTFTLTRDEIMRISQIVTSSKIK